MNKAIKRSTRNFDRNVNLTFNTMKDATLKLGLTVVLLNKKSGVLDVATKKSFFIFGGLKYALNARSISPQETQVTISAKSDVSQNNLDAMAESIYKLMDEKLPLRLQ